MILKEHVQSSKNFFISILLSILPELVYSQEPIILEIIVNTESHGVYNLLKKDHDFLIKVEDFLEIGFKKPAGTTVQINEDKYISLSSLAPDLTFKFNEKNLSLEITGNHVLFKKLTYDMKRFYTPKNLVTEKYSSFFLNYSLTGSWFYLNDFNTFEMFGESGLRASDYLFMTDFSVRDTGGQYEIIRGFSNMTWDDERNLYRFIIGDSIFYTTPLGGNGTFGGISFSKQFNIDPYFLPFPSIDFHGWTETPSQMELYVNDSLIGREEIKAGEFELRNLPVTAGSGEAVVILRDAFGRERKLIHPFYYSTLLLKKGTHNFSYNMGYLRKNIDFESFDYEKIPVFSGFHYAGLTNNFTFGATLEGTKDLLNPGMVFLYNVFDKGIISANFAGSFNNGREGYAYDIGYSLMSYSINMLFDIGSMSHDYSNISIDQEKEKKRLFASSLFGYGFNGLGSLSFGVQYNDFYFANDSLRFSMYYNVSPFKNTHLFVGSSFTRRFGIPIDDLGFEYDINVGLIHSFKDTASMSTGATVKGSTGKKDDIYGTLHASKSPPVGEGAGGYGSIYANDQDAYGMAHGIYNSKYGILNADWTKMQDAESTYTVSFSGALSYIDGSVNLSRPIYDSFGVTRVLNTAEEFQDVRVYFNNQTIGKTDEKGESFIPNLLSYHYNKVAIEDRDVPINYELDEIVKYVKPDYRAGSIIEFKVNKIQGISGYLFMIKDDKKIPVEFALLTIKEKQIFIPTGRGGEFYIQNLPAGKYEAHAQLKKTECDAYIIVPESKEFFINLGEIMCK